MFVNTPMAHLAPTIHAPGMRDSITLYGFGDNDRSGKVRWVARELGLTVDEQPVTPGDHYKPPYAALNAYKHVPTATFRGQTLRESTAICHWLAESVETPKLWIGPGESGRDVYLYWLAVFGETFESRLVETAVAMAGIADARFVELHDKALRRKLAVAAAELPESGYLCGDAFTLADVLAGYSLRLAVQTGVIEREAVDPYLSRLVDRPAARESRIFASL